MFCRHAHQKVVLIIVGLLFVATIYSVGVPGARTKATAPDDALPSTSRWAFSCYSHHVNPSARHRSPHRLRRLVELRPPPATMGRAVNR